MSAMVMITAHVKSESHTCDTLCMLSTIENPLSDFLFVVIFDVMRGNFPFRDSWWYSVHFSMSSTSHVKSFVRMHLPPNLSVWQQRRHQARQLRRPYHAAFMYVCTDACMQYTCILHTVWLSHESRSHSK